MIGGVVYWIYRQLGIGEIVIVVPDTPGIEFRDRGERLYWRDSGERLYFTDEGS